MEEQSELPKSVEKVFQTWPDFDPYGYIVDKHKLDRSVVKEKIVPMLVNEEKVFVTRKEVITAMEKVLVDEKLIKKVLRIIKYNERDGSLYSNKLKVVSTSVTEFNQELIELSEKMLNILKFSSGFALSAPQVDMPIRMFVWNDPEIKCKDKVIVNPEILEATGRMKFEEYCPSFPGLWVKTKRKSFVKMKYQDVHGNEKEYSISGVAAVCIQHEINHLDGILISDHGSLVKEK